MRLSARLTEREFAVLETIDRLGMVTASQIERLHFYDFKKEESAVRVRQRTLRRFVDERLAFSVLRSKGGTDQWSGQPTYALDRVGEQLMRQRQGISGTYRPSRLSLPSLQLVDHMLDISELYVRLVEASRTELFRIPVFATEPASWWQASDKQQMKPDAYAQLSAHGFADHWWIECDRGTESIPVVVTQLDAYIKFRRSGQKGPYEVSPNVLLTVPDDKRATKLRTALEGTRNVPKGLITITAYDAAVGLLATKIHGPA